MLSHSEAFWLQFSTVLVAILGPIIAVIMTLWYQDRQSKRTAKMNLFLTLISARNMIPIDYNYILALNRIDVVFHGNKEILRLWHEYYDILMQPQVNDVPQRRDHKRIELLFHIGHHLGYRGLQQIDLEKYYQPVGHYEGIVLNQDILRELLRVLRNTETLNIKPTDTIALPPDIQKGNIHAK